ncbi:MAG: alkaline phosphatase family protein [Holophagales bacterium]|nr:alkaline phosphatase family protein [Holophagales bacterium]
MAGSSLRAVLVRRLSLLALALLAVPTLLGAVAYYDRSLQPAHDFRPVLQASALDELGPTWERGSAVSPPCAEGELQLPERWLMIGWDGADWRFLLPLLEAGRLPHLESLLREGAYGTLASMVPTLSPTIWTTVATGHSPGDHGILHFYNQRPILERWWQRLKNFGEPERNLFSNADRRKRAIWNLLGEHGRSVLTVGYHNTFPAEEVDGMMVSNYLVLDSVAQAMELDAAGTGEVAAGLVHPPEALPEVLDIQRRVNAQVPEAVRELAAIPDDELTSFLRASRHLESERDQKPYFLVHSWVFDTIVAEIADAYLGRMRPDLALVHFQAVDWASHRFLYHHAPELFEGMGWPDEVRAELEADRGRYGGTVEAFYVYLDRWLGRLLAHRDETTGVLVMSDHGFEAHADPEIPGGHDHAPPGILVAQGPGIRRGEIEGATVYDILPTLMASLGLPVADDLPGKALTSAFCDSAYDPDAQPRVASYGTSTAYVPAIPKPDALDSEVMEQLRSLGYID